MYKEDIIKGHYSTNLKQVWLKAAVVGGLWASIEIIIGSFLHNLRIPFAGSVLTAQALVLLLAFYQVWPIKGLIWRAGLICALMKSISPSYVILGPMSGIFFEALLLELGILMMGPHIGGFLLGGALGMLSSFVHKIITLLILYGLNIVELYKNVYIFLAKQVNVQDADPWILIWIFVVAYVFVGMMSAMLGWYIGKKTRSINPDGSPGTVQRIEDKGFFKTDQTRRFSVPLLFLHVFMILSGLLMLNFLHLYVAAIPIVVYLAFCLWHYKRAVQRLRKPIFWVQLIIIIILAAVFGKNIGREGPFFEIEGLMIGLEMSLRAVFIIISFSSFSVELRNPLVESVFAKGRFKNLYQALELAFGALPVMIGNMPGPRQFFRNPIIWFALINAQANKWFTAFQNKKAS